MNSISSAIVETNLPTRFGNFKLKAYQSEFEQFPHLALFTEDYLEKEIIDVRIHSECMTGDVFGSAKCDCGEQLDYSMRWIQKHGGAILYLRQEGRGIGLVNKLMAYNLQEDGLNTREANLELGFHADPRNYEKAIEMLNDLGIEKIRLLTNNPEKIKAFEHTEIQLVDRIPIEIKPGLENLSYLETKKNEMGHLLTKTNGFQRK
ncbi:MAG: GTP cyclohydrolase II [Flammeovirgaceae bacterium]|nr:GTP cyclohydrolase II [Flammeovirgaceae bacterium]